MIQNKTLSILTIINILFINIFASKDNLLSSNLSRIANNSVRDYLLFLLICFLFGVNEYLILKRYNLKKLYILGFLSLLIGAVTPYNYLNTRALSSDIHLIFGFVSIIFILIVELSLIIYIRNINIILSNILLYGLAIVALITLYFYGAYGFMNGLNELIYLDYILLSQLVINNVI